MVEGGLFSQNSRCAADMLYMDVSSIAMQGLQQAQLQLENSAQRIATAGTTDATGVDTVNLSQEAVSMIGAKNQFAANVNVMKIADNMQKNLLNLLG